MYFSVNSRLFKCVATAKDSSYSMEEEYRCYYIYIYIYLGGMNPSNKIFN